MPFQLPPLNLANSSGSGLNGGGSSWMASGPGDWNVNLGGSGTAAQGISAGGLQPWMLLVAAVAVLYILKK